MLKVVVDRTKWFRGHSSLDSRLRLSPHIVHAAAVQGRTITEGQMCCLGFACLAAGWTVSNINGYGFPHTALNADPNLDIPLALMKLVEGRREDAYDSSSLCASIGAVNDDNTYTDAEREAKLIVYGKRAGLEFEFIN